MSPLQAHSTELHQRPTELASQVRAELFAGGERVLFRFDPRPAQAEDLGAVDATSSMYASDGGLAVTPAFHHDGPFLGHVVLRDPLQRAYDLAVDQTGEERIELARHDRDAGFVQEQQILRNLAVQDQAAGFGDARHRCGRRLVLATERDALSGPLQRAVEVSRQEPFITLHHREPSVDRGRVTALQ